MEKIKLPESIQAKVEKNHRNPRPDREFGNLEFTPAYRDSLFIVWYNAGKPRGAGLMQCIPPDENGRIPYYTTVMHWFQKDNWAQRAHELDAEVTRRVQEIAIEEKVEMFKRHAESGRILMERGLEFILDDSKSIETMSEALKMVKVGSDIERQSTGGAQALSRMARMSDTSLQATISRLLDKLDEDELNSLEAAMGDSEVVDVEAKEVPPNTDTQK